MQKLLITTLCALALPAFAAYPEKPVRLIVPLAAGGGMDTTARSIATPLGERLGQTSTNNGTARNAQRIFQCRI